MSSAPNAAQALLDQLRSSLDGASYSTSAVYASIIIAFGGAAAITALVFLIWHSCRDIYAARELLAERLNAIYAGAREIVAPRLRKCLRIAWKTKEHDLVETSGLDAAIYVRALRMMRNIFAVLTVLLFGTAAPINIVFNLHSKIGTNLTRHDALLLLTPSLLSSSQMIPHVVLAWIANGVVFVFVWYNYRKVLHMRQAVLNGPSHCSRVENRTVLIMDLPRSSRSLEGVARVAKSLNPRASPLGITLGLSSRRLHDLIDEHESKIKLYERALVDKAASLSISELKQTTDKLARNIEHERLSLAGPPQGYAFVSYRTQQEAHATARLSRNAPDGIKARVAPPPDQVIWRNIGLGPAERGAKQMWVNTVYGILIILWIVPNAFIGCFLSNLSRLAAVWPAFGRSMASNRIGFAILQGFLAPTVSTMVFMVLPFLFRKLSHLQGKVTRTDREHEVLRKLYAFFFLDNFFVFSIMGVVWDIVAQVLQVTNKASKNGEHLTFAEVWQTLRIAQRIATAIVNISSFWVMYLMRAVLGEFASSAQPVTLLRRLGQLLNFVRQPTPREKADTSMPQPFQYAVNFLGILFHTTISLGFTTIQPLVLPICFVLYLLAVPIKKYELLHMQITKYESNGLFWPLIVDITLFAVAFGNLMLLCVVWVQAGWKIAVAAAPLALTVILFKIFMFFKYEKHFYYADSTLSPLSLTLTSQSSSEKPSVETVEECYEDPARSAALAIPLLTFDEALCSLASHDTRTKNVQNPFEPELERHTSHDSGNSQVDLKVSTAAPRSFSGVFGPEVPYTPVEPDAAYGYDSESLYMYEPYAAEQHDRNAYYDGENYQAYNFNEHRIHEPQLAEQRGRVASERFLTEDEERLL